MNNIVIGMNIIATIIGYIVITIATPLIIAKTLVFLVRLYEVNFIWEIEHNRVVEHRHIVEVIERIQNG